MSVSCKFRFAKIRSRCAQCSTAGGSWNPSIEPTRDDHKVYLVVDGFGRIFRERDVETTVTDLMSEQYVAPVRVVAVNPAEHKIEDASEDIALEILRRADLTGQELPSSIKAFVDN